MKRLISVLALATLITGCGSQVGGLPAPTSETSPKPPPKVAKTEEVAVNSPTLTTEVPAKRQAQADRGADDPRPPDVTRRGPPRFKRLPSGPVVACFSSDGKWLLAATHNCKVMLWGPESNEPVWTCQATTELETRYDCGYDSGYDDWRDIYAPFALTFAVDGKRVFCAWAAGVAEIDRQNGTIIRTTKFPKLIARASGPSPWVAFLPGSDECVFYGEDERLVRFDFRAGKIHDKANVHIPNIYLAHVAVSPDGKRVLTYGGGQWGRYMAEWNLDTGEYIRLFDEKEGGFNIVAYSPDGNGIWVGTEFLDRKTGKWVSLPGVLSKYEGWLWPSPDGKHALGLPSGDREEERLDVIRLSDGKVLREFSSDGLWYHRLSPTDPTFETLSARPEIAAFTPDGKTVMLTGVRGWEAELGFFDLTTGKRTRTIQYQYQR